MPNIFTRLFKRDTPQVPDVSVTQDAFGNWWYVPKRMTGKKFDFDLRNDEDKVCAMMTCTPLYMVLDKLGNMMSRANLYVVDDKGNELPKGEKAASLLAQPNPLQDFGAFVKELEINMRLFGYAAILIQRGLATAFPNALWVLPNELLHIKANPNYLRASSLDEIITRAFIKWGGRDIDIADYELALILDAKFIIPTSAAQTEDYVKFNCSTDALTIPVNNWLSAMSASYNLLVNGGPKGILTGESTDDIGTAAIKPAEEDEIRNRVRASYGMAGDKWQIMVTRYPLKWQAVDYNASQLRIDENDERMTSLICNAYGVNPNLFTDAKYDNQESAKKSTYQDVIIPDSLKIAKSLTQIVCPEGMHVWLDFSDVECLQSNRKDEADTLNSIGNALINLLNANLITEEEARQELVSYLEIDAKK